MKVDLGDGLGLLMRMLGKKRQQSASAVCQIQEEHVRRIKISKGMAQHGPTEESVDEDFMVIKPIVLW